MLRFMEYKIKKSIRFYKFIIYFWQPNRMERIELDIFTCYILFQKYNRINPNTNQNCNFYNDDVLCGHLNPSGGHRGQVRHRLQLNILKLKWVMGSLDKSMWSRNDPLDLGGQLKMDVLRLGQMLKAHRIAKLLEYRTWCQEWTCFINQSRCSKWWVA